MEGMFALVAAIAALGLLIRLAAGGLDGERIDAYLRKRGYKVIDRSWAPFGTGWFGERDSRIYEVVYEDDVGNKRRATVKTSMFSGVYLTDDRIVEAAAPPDDEVARLRAENERLRAQLARGGSAGDPNAG